MTPQPHPDIDGQAIYTDLLNIEKEAADLKELEIKLQVLVAGIRQGKFNISRPTQAAPEGCPYWKDSYNLKSDCRDQGIGKFYCAKPTAAHAASIRKDIIYAILKDLGYGCPGGEATHICEMCKANQYCIELRTEEQR